MELSLVEMFKTNPGSDGICQQCFLGAHFTVEVKKVFKHILVVRNQDVVPAGKQHLANYQVELWPVTETKTNIRERQWLLMFI